MSALRQRSCLPSQPPTTPTNHKWRRQQWMPSDNATSHAPKRLQLHVSLCMYVRVCACVCASVYETVTAYAKNVAHK